MIEVVHCLLYSMVTDHRDVVGDMFWETAFGAHLLCKENDPLTIIEEMEIEPAFRYLGVIRYFWRTDGVDCLRCLARIKAIERGEIV